MAALEVACLEVDLQGDNKTSCSSFKDCDICNTFSSFKGRLELLPFLVQMILPDFKLNTLLAFAVDKQHQTHWEKHQLASWDQAKYTAIFVTLNTYV